MFHTITAELERQSALRPRRDRLSLGAVLLVLFALALVIGLFGASLIGARPASATEHDDEVRYTVTAEGITLPAGQVFQAHGHVNWHTTWAQHSVHFDPNNNQPGGAYIGKSFLPFNLEPGECVIWTQVHGFNYHFDAKKEEREICKPKTPPTPEPTPEPTELPTEEPTTPPVTEEPTEEPTEPPATEEPTTPPTTEPEPEPSWTPPVVVPSPEPSSPSEPEPSPSTTTGSPSPEPSSAPAPSSPSSSAPPAPSVVASPITTSSSDSSTTASSTSRTSSSDSATAPELARTGINPIAWVVLALVLSLAGLGALAIRRRSDS